MPKSEFLPLVKPVKKQTAQALGVQTQNRFLPEIPQANLSADLPQELLDQMNTVEKSNTAFRMKERQRLDKTANALLEANKEINSAENQLQKTNESVLLDFAGIFNSDYNRQFQRGRITKAQRKVNTVKLENEISRSKDLLDLEDAKGPLTEYQQFLKLKMQQANLTTAQSNAIISSNTAKANMLKMLQSNVTEEEISTVEKSKNYTDIVTEQFIGERRNSQRKTRNEFISAELANARNMLSFKSEKIADGLTSMPSADKRFLLNKAETDGESLIKIPGTNVTVTTQQMRTSLAANDTEEQKAFKEIVENNIAIAKNDAGLSSSLNQVQNVSANFINPKIVEGELSQLNLAGFNLLNIDDKSMQTIPWEQVHPGIRQPMQEYMQAISNNNQKRDIGQNVTREDLTAVKVLETRLNKKIEKTETAMIEAMPKESRAGQKEWNLNQRMSNSDNMASMVVTHLLTAPNLGSDLALESSWSILSENLADITVGSKQNWAELSPEERTNQIFQLIAGQNLTGDARSRDLITKAVNEKNVNGVTPLAAWVNNKSVMIMQQAFSNLADKRPDLKPFLMDLGQRTRFQDHKQIGIEIANFSFQSQLKTPDLPDNFLSQELAAELNNVIAKQGPIWNQQMNPVRGSLMGLMFKRTPSVIVDGALGQSFGTNAADAWLILKPEAPVGQLAKPIEPIRRREEGPAPNPFELDLNVPLITR